MRLGNHPFTTLIDSKQIYQLLVTLKSWWEKEHLFDTKLTQQSHEEKQHWILLGGINSKGPFVTSKQNEYQEMLRNHYYT